MPRLARMASLLAVAAGLALGVFILFGPTGTICSLGPIGLEQPTATFSPANCHSTNLVTVQRDSLFPAPLLFIAAWALAPLLAFAGVRMRFRGQAFGLVLVLLAFLVEASSFISMGGGFLFALYVSPFLFIALLASLRARPAVAP